MSLVLIKLLFCLVAVAVIGIAVEVVGGLPGWGIAVITCGTLPLFNWGCHRAAGQAYDQGADDALNVVERHLDH